MQQRSPTATARRMRANRAALAGACRTCGQGFRLLEDIYACEVCSGFHHASCWESLGRCPDRPDEDGSRVLGFEPAPTPPVERVGGWEVGEPTTAGSPQLCPRCGLLSPSSTPRCDCGHQFSASAPAREAPPDEKTCPNCEKSIKAEALKCRFCGCVLDPQLIDREVPHAVVTDIETNAGQALTYGIVSVFICAPILAPMAISRGRHALGLLGEHHGYEGGAGARRKARIGVAVAWFAMALFALGLLARLSNP